MKNIRNNTPISATGRPIPVNSNMPSGSCPIVTSMPDTMRFVEVVNGTRESDGSYKHYFLRVPPNVTTARQAVAWTYGLTAEQYRPLIRT